MKPNAPMGRRWALLAVVLFVAASCIVSSGCTEDGQVVRSGGQSTPDAGEVSDDADATTVAERPSKPGSHLCAAGGTAKGEGIVLHGCFGPVELSTPVLSGDGYQLEGGTFERVAP